MRAGIAAEHHRQTIADLAQVGVMRDVARDIQRARARQCQRIGRQVTRRHRQGLRRAQAWQVNRACAVDQAAVGVDGQAGQRGQIDIGRNIGQRHRTVQPAIGHVDQRNRAGIGPAVDARGDGKARGLTRLHGQRGSRRCGANLYMRTGIAAERHRHAVAKMTQVYASRDVTLDIERARARQRQSAAGQAGRADLYRLRRRQRGQRNRAAMAVGQGAIADSHVPQPGQIDVGRQVGKIERAGGAKRAIAVVDHHDSAGIGPVRSGAGDTAPGRLAGGQHQSGTRHLRAGQRRARRGDEGHADRAGNVAEVGVAGQRGARQTDFECPPGSGHLDRRAGDNRRAQDQDIAAGQRWHRDRARRAAGKGVVIARKAGEIGNAAQVNGQARRAARHRGADRHAGKIDIGTAQRATQRNRRRIAAAERGVGHHVDAARAGGVHRQDIALGQRHGVVGAERRRNRRRKVGQIDRPGGVHDQRAAAVERARHIDNARTRHGQRRTGGRAGRQQLAGRHGQLLPAGQRRHRAKADLAAGGRHRCTRKRDVALHVAEVDLVGVGAGQINLAQHRARTDVLDMRARGRAGLQRQRVLRRQRGRRRNFDHDRTQRAADRQRDAAAGHDPVGQGGDVAEIDRSAGRSGQEDRARAADGGPAGRIDRQAKRYRVPDIDRRIGDARDGTRDRGIAVDVDRRRAEDCVVEDGPGGQMDRSAAKVGRFDCRVGADIECDRARSADIAEIDAAKRLGGALACTDRQLTADRNCLAGHFRRIQREHLARSDRCGQQQRIAAQQGYLRQIDPLQTAADMAEIKHGVGDWRIGHGQPGGPGAAGGIDRMAIQRKGINRQRDTLGQLDLDRAQNGRLGNRGGRARVDNAVDRSGARRGGDTAEIGRNGPAGRHDRQRAIVRQRLRGAGELVVVDQQRFAGVDRGGQNDRAADPGQIDRVARCHRQRTQVWRGRTGDCAVNRDIARTRDRQRRPDRIDIRDQVVAVEQDPAQPCQRRGDGRVRARARIAEIGAAVERQADRNVAGNPAQIDPAQGVGRGRIGGAAMADQHQTRAGGAVRGGQGQRTALHLRGVERDRLVRNQRGQRDCIRAIAVGVVDQLPVDHRQVGNIGEVKAAGIGAEVKVVLDAAAEERRDRATGHTRLGAGGGGDRGRGQIAHVDFGIAVQPDIQRCQTGEGLRAVLAVVDVLQLDRGDRTRAGVAIDRQYGQIRAGNRLDHARRVGVQRDMRDTAGACQRVQRQRNGERRRAAAAAHRRAAAA